MAILYLGEMMTSTEYDFFYNILKSMYCRCYRETDPDKYESYQGKGITICEEWRRVPNPKNDQQLIEVNKQKTLNFAKWAIENGYKQGLTIDRKDNNKGYSPENCRWVTNRIQAFNRDKRKDAESKFWGVTFDKQSQYYLGTLVVDNRHISVGSFETELDAAKAYNNFVTKNNINRPLNVIEE